MSTLHSGYCVFEYMYRDAANWKTSGQVLLIGSFCASLVDDIVEGLDGGMCFVAEQVGIPPLQQQHLDFYKPIEDKDVDHAFHEFIALRPAEAHEMNELAVVVDLAALVDRFRASANRWDCSLPPFCGR